MNNIIHSVDLTKIYGEKETSVKALDDISVEFKENDFIYPVNIFKVKNN